MTSRVKICGITRVEDAIAASELGADAIGLVFYPPSPRYVSELSLARDIAMSAGPFVDVVGLFVNATAAEIDQVLKQVPLNCLQFHGDESPESCEHWARPYIKALRMKEGLDLAREKQRYSSARALLLDSYVKGVPGGTGEAFNWHRVPQQLGPIVLAGGLLPENVASANTIAKPWALDVSGGVETSPGIKDRNKIAAFINNAKLECASD
ncbi:phosphoribosylanthranilate isomerase [Agaribacterium haliotis]|uniref:phosphoribosylanthranilate isomerase n=1 Tax=Agaribacterium haliotis TaxID=2013869 RepID=UPI000BB57104|nr:phosphoribosylanthranilate isomerase [Agaribacterium haliotis]